jgi:hypothetical protein
VTVGGKKGLTVTQSPLITGGDSRRSERINSNTISTYNRGVNTVLLFTLSDLLLSPPVISGDCVTVYPF